MSNSITKNNVGIIHSGIHLGQKKEGIQLASQYLKEAGLINHLTKQCSSVADFGFIRDCEKKTSYFELSKLCSVCSSRSDLSLILGGDHSQAIGAIHGLKKTYSNLKVIWVDAHGDINTPETSPTGNLHGMPLAALLGLFELNKQNEFSWFSSVLKPQDIALIGVRDLDEGEKKIISDNGIFCLSAEEVTDFGIKQSVDMALEVIDPFDECPIHLSVDVDCLSEEYISATGLPVKNGFSPGQLIELVKLITLTERVKSLEVVEFNPLLAANERELYLTVHLIIALAKVVAEKSSKRESFEKLPQELFSPEFYF